MVAAASRKAGASGAYPSEVHSRGGKGGEDLARGVVEACRKPAERRFIYEISASIRAKIEALATKVYGAGRVDFLPEAEKKMKFFESNGYGDLPVNMAKTHLSLSHDPLLKGAPTGFALPVRDIHLSAGAGFLYALCGEMQTMPGLPSVPAFMHVDLDEDGEIVGLS
jgi:formyltetrahydrofolate synthetase